MVKYNVEVMITNGEELEFAQIEAASEEEAINEVANFEDDFVIFKKDSTYYKINDEKIVGYKVTSDSEEEPVKRALN